jgi:hypothetical protein
MGASTIAFRPPLLGPAKYDIAVHLDERRTCEFHVELADRAKVIGQECDLKWQLQVRGPTAQPAIVGVVISAAPEAMRLFVRRDEERIYDTRISPAYVEANPAERGETPDFCGQSSLLKPDCIRGTSQCKPFVASCDGPEDCPGKQSCCAAPGWGMEYGAERSMECTSRSACLTRIESFVICHEDADCPKDMACSDRSLEGDFDKTLLACAPR